MQNRMNKTKIKQIVMIFVILLAIHLVYSANYGAGNYGANTYGTAIDTDNDGIADENDPLIYNESNVDTSGITNLNITIGTNTTAGTHSGVQDITFYDQTNKILNFTHDFASSNLDLSKVTITKATNSIIINLSSQVQTNYNKTIFITDNSFIALCVKDAEIDNINNISSDCNHPAETDFTDCLGNNTGITLNGTTCIDIGSIITISNLHYSAIRGTPRSPTPETPSTTGGSSADTGGGGGIINLTKKPECSENSDCKKDQYCFENKCHKAECFDDSVCNTDKGETCFQYRCVKLFDMEILEFESPVKVGDFFDFTYFVKAVAEIKGDVEIKFWIEQQGNKISSGQDTMYFDSYEEKTKTKKLFLPEDISSGTYTFYIEVTYGKYTASAHRTIGISVKDGKAVIEMPVKTSRFKEYIIFGLLEIIIIILLYILYLKRKKIKRKLMRLRRWTNKHKFSILLIVLIILIIALGYYLRLYNFIKKWFLDALFWLMSLFNNNIYSHLVSYWHYLLIIIILLIVIVLIFFRKKPRQKKKKRHRHIRHKKKLTKNIKEIKMKKVTQRVKDYQKKMDQRLKKRQKKIHDEIEKEKRLFKLKKRLNK